MDNYPDAHQLKDSLRSRGFSEAFVVMEDNPNGLAGQPVYLTPSSNFFNVNLLPPLQEILSGSYDLSGLPSEDVLEIMPAEEVRTILKPIIDSRDDTDPLKGYALYYFALASEQSLAKENASMSVDILAKLVSGKIACPHDLRVKAAAHAADLMHYTKKEYYQAYRMYKILLASDWFQGHSRAELQAELAGTLLEMMDSGGKGNSVDVRHELQELYSAMSGDFPEPKARVELMYSETYFWDKKSEDIALEYSQLIQEKYAQFPQLYAQAIWNEAIALERMGKPKEARDLLPIILSIEIPTHQAFRKRLDHFNMEKRVSRYLARLNNSLGEREAHLFWKNRENSVKIETANLTKIRIPGLLE